MELVTWWSESWGDGDGGGEGVMVRGRVAGARMERGGEGARWVDGAGLGGPRAAVF